MGLAVLLVLVTLTAAELSMRLLLMSSQLTGKRSYEELARHTFGRGGQAAVAFCILAMNVGSVVAYLNILTDTVSNVAGEAGRWHCWGTSVVRCRQAGRQAGRQEMNRHLLAAGQGAARTGRRSV